MIFRNNNGIETEKKSEWLKVKDLEATPDHTDNFVIKDEVSSGRSKYEKEGEASGMIQRLSDKKLFMKSFKEIELTKLIEAFGEDSKKWIGKEIEVKMLISKKWNKPFLAINPVVDINEPF